MSKEQSSAYVRHFWNCVRKKPVSKITVTELAERTMINKVTFYPYYIDIYTLYTEIIKEACMFVFDKIEDYSLFFTDPENDIKPECIIYSLFVIRHSHYENDPDTSVRIMADIIKRSF